MKRRVEFNTLGIIIGILSILALYELCSIMRSIYIIKKQNIVVNAENIELKKHNSELKSINSLLENVISRFRDPEITPPDIPKSWRVYRYLEYGFEIGYPPNFTVSENSPSEALRSSEEGRKISIYSEADKKRLDINIIDIGDYKDVTGYINYKYKYKVYKKSHFFFNNKRYDIYKMSGQKLYYIFFANSRYILSVEAPSEYFLIDVAKTIKFI